MFRKYPPLEILVIPVAWFRAFGFEGSEFRATVNERLSKAEIIVVSGKLKARKSLSVIENFRDHY